MQKLLAQQEKVYSRLWLLKKALRQTPVNLDSHTKSFRLYFHHKLRGFERKDAKLGKLEVSSETYHNRSDIGCPVEHPLGVDGAKDFSDGICLQLFPPNSPQESREDGFLVRLFVAYGVGGTVKDVVDFRQGSRGRR